VTIKKLLADSCFLRAIPLLTRQLARHDAIGVDFLWKQGKTGPIAFVMKRPEQMKQAAA
jgi:hypothetical protein